ncbi:hypothetical protein MHK_010785, partial [Candidatus Magnetomorum sp. HK-1]
ANVGKLNKINFNVPKIDIKSVQSDIIAYHDYLKPEEKMLNINIPYSEDTSFVDYSYNYTHTPLSLHIDEDSTIVFDSEFDPIFDPEKLLDAAYVKYSPDALLETEKESFYEVKWIFDQNGNDAEMRNENETENIQTLIWNNDNIQESEKIHHESMLINELAASASVSEKEFVPRIEKTMLKHLSIEDLQPKKGWMYKVRRAFASLVQDN